MVEHKAKHRVRLIRQMVGLERTLRNIQDNTY
jgi:hypothetical protein